MPLKEHIWHSQKVERPAEICKMSEGISDKELHLFDVWFSNSCRRLFRSPKVESAGLTGTLPKFKLNLHVEDQGKLVNVRQRLPTNGVNGDKLFNGILSIDPLLGQPWIGKNPKYDMVNIVGTDGRLVTKTTTLGLVIYYTRLVALRKHGNVYDQLESKVPRLLDSDGYPKIMRHTKNLAESVKGWLNSHCHAPHWKSLGWCHLTSLLV